MNFNNQQKDQFEELMRLKQTAKENQNNRINIMDFMPRDLLASNLT